MIINPNHNIIVAQNSNINKQTGKGNITEAILQSTWNRYKMAEPLQRSTQTNVNIPTSILQL